MWCGCKVVNIEKILIVPGWHGFLVGSVVIVKAACCVVASHHGDVSVGVVEVVAMRKYSIARMAFILKRHKTLNQRPEIIKFLTILLLNHNHKLLFLQSCKYR